MNAIHDLSYKSETSHPAYLNAYSCTQETWTVAYSPFGGKAGKTDENGLNAPRKVIRRPSGVRILRGLASCFRTGCRPSCTRTGHNMPSTGHVVRQSKAVDFAPGLAHALCKLLDLLEYTIRNRNCRFHAISRTADGLRTKGENKRFLRRQLALRQDPHFASLDPHSPLGDKLDGLGIGLTFGLEDAGG